MIAKINTGSNLYGALAYNQEKVDEGLGKILVGNNLKEVGIRLNEISAKARTHGAHEPIGTLYGFTLLVKTETTLKEGFDMVQNRFFVKGEVKSCTITTTG
jgi:hypothetical protein